MIPTNYYLFDFLDFDENLSKQESLWKACQPTSVTEHQGDIWVTVPFQKQQNSNDMAPDTTAEREVYTVIIRQYAPKIIRVFAAFSPTAAVPADSDEEPEDGEES